MDACTLWEDAWRSVHNTFSEMGYDNQCDNTTLPASLGGSTAWTVFYGDAGRRMPTAPPGWRRCGSQNTGWLATPHPPVGSAPREGVVCFQTGNAPEHYCGHTARVRTCSCAYDGVQVTYAYQFVAPWACPTAY